ncbi:MAG: hypothetical protein HZA17_08745 [Nitrospirae bacterium]|nr:hypothetical protein [Nitrospirota bacterium]
MPDQRKTLPRPPKTPFGSGKRLDDKEVTELKADKIAQAMAEGRLDEFMQSEMPDNEQARKLVSLMMGMTGMMPSMDIPPAEEKKYAADEGRDKADKSQEPSDSNVLPADLMSAAGAGDMNRLKEILAREHKRRSPGADAGEQSAAQEPSGNAPVIEKDVIDRLIRIASDNSVTVDWLILRAIKVYVQEYDKSGRL